MARLTDYLQSRWGFTTPGYSKTHYAIPIDGDEPAKNIERIRSAIGRDGLSKDELMGPTRSACEGQIQDQW